MAISFKQQPFQKMLRQDMAGSTGGGQSKVSDNPHGGEGRLRIYAYGPLREDYKNEPQHHSAINYYTVRVATKSPEDLQRASEDAQTLLERISFAPNSALDTRTHPRIYKFGAGLSNLYLEITCVGYASSEEKDVISLLWEASKRLRARYEEGKEVKMTALRPSTPSSESSSKDSTIIYYEDGIRVKNTITPNAFEQVQGFLSTEHTQKAIYELYETLGSLQGRTILFGITASGLIVAVKEGVGPDSDRPGFMAWAIDVSSPNNVRRVETDFSYGSVNRLRDGGSTFFPSKSASEILSKLVRKPYAETTCTNSSNSRARILHPVYRVYKSEAEITQEYPRDPGMVGFLQFAKMVGSFSIPYQTGEINPLPSVNGNTLYPLKVNGKEVIITSVVTDSH